MITYRWGHRQCALLVLRRERTHCGLLFGVRFQFREEHALEIRVVKRPVPGSWPSIDAETECEKFITGWAPYATADEGLPGLAVNVVAGVRAFATGTGPGGREMRL